MSFGESQSQKIKTYHMKYLFIFLFSAFSFHLCGQNIINDPNVEVRTVGSFSGLKVSGGIDVYLSQSNEYALAVSASEIKYRDNIQTQIINGILTISYNNGGLRFSGDKKLRVYISFKTLESIQASGACDINFKEGFKANVLKIGLSGASEIRGNININDLTLDLSGASTVKLKGNVINLRIDASGASDVKNYEIVADNCIASTSGASDVKITVNKSLSAKASGASSLLYRGNPDKKEISTSGASKISQK